VFSRLGDANMNGGELHVQVPGPACNMEDSILYNR
jgi:hypothetical protein